MSDALALPPRPNIEQYRKLAKDFQEACKTGDPDKLRGWAIKWAESVARLQGFPGTPEVGSNINQDAERIRRQWETLLKSNSQAARCTLAGAQLLIARCHGFDSWPVFSKQVEALARAGSPESQFESAADAIAAGNIGTLKKLLQDNPELVRVRSAREHRSTLLHYVSANGIEDFRQKTPGNIIEIATLLLDAGVDINSESRAYGGGSTALGLTATSYHPEAAGVQLQLLDLLIERGAVIDSGTGSTVNACLRNGRGEAAEYLANRGARLDLEGAAGIGRLDIVKRSFDGGGNLQPVGARQQLVDGFTWACEFGRNHVIEFLLSHGMKVDTRLKGGETGLHWAAYEGYADTVRMLLGHDAPVDIADAVHGGTPLEWALYGWGNRRQRERERRPYHEAVALLVRAGSKLDPQWFNGDAERERAAKAMRSDARMAAALRGEVSHITAANPANVADRSVRNIQLQIITPRDLTCSFSPDQIHLATGVVGRSVRIWNIKRGECIRQLVGHTERVWGLAWSTDGQRILSGSWDNTARLWDVTTGKCLLVLRGHSGFVRATALSADGRRAITAGGDKADRSVRVWDLQTGECLQVFEGHTEGAYCALLGSDGRRAVSGSRDGTVRLWDIESGRCLRAIDAHHTHVQHLAWHKDEQRIISCSLHLRLWNLETGQCLQDFEGHTDTIRTVEWSPDYRFIVSASHDRTVRIFGRQPRDVA